MSIQEQLRGTGVAIITPFTADEKVDYEALGKVLDHIIDHGVDYVVTLGTTGETPVLSKEEKINITHMKSMRRTENIMFHFVMVKKSTRIWK